VALDVDAWGGGDVIAVDDGFGAAAAAQHIYKLGHRDVAVVLIAEHPDAAVDEQGGISARRLAGIRQGFETARAEANGRGAGAVRLRILSAPVSEEGGRAAFAELAADELPTAVMAITDMTAIGILNAAIDAGVRVPDELSIVGYDDIPAAAWVSPRLTTVHQPIREKGRLAARRVIDLARSPAGQQPAIEILPTRLVVRGSTAPPHRRGGAPRS
jgi:DNA-binding LacI/PurR family transcriptional regulator